MDPRTRMILFKLLNQGFFRQIDGCLSTGKEANVYYAVGGEVRGFAQNVTCDTIFLSQGGDCCNFVLLSSFFLSDYYDIGVERHGEI